MAAAEPTSCNNYLREKAPKFRLARLNQNENMQSATLFISVSPIDITQDKLLILSCSLGRTYAKKQILVVWILDDYKAAKRYNPQGEGNDFATITALRASYGFSREENDQSLTWWPDRRNHYGSTVEVKLGPPPPCPVV